jgi:hypothetical protein
MSKLAPTEFSAWLNLDKIAVREDGAVLGRYRELIALGLAFTTQCPYFGVQQLRSRSHIHKWQVVGPYRSPASADPLLVRRLRIHRQRTQQNRRSKCTTLWPSFKVRQ